MARKQKVLMVAHGHPDFNPGGGEIAAYQLHKALNGGYAATARSSSRDGNDKHAVDTAADVEFESIFFARHGQDDLVHGGTPFAGTGRPGEVLFHSSMPDWFRFSQPDKARVWRDFRGFLELHQPDIVHFHHYFQLGLELIREVKNVNPNTRIVLTLHEYMAICNNEGQMQKVSGELCYESSPAACAACFKNKTAQDFFLRRQFIQSCFECVDRFIAPSNFLKQRYVAWGLADSSIDVMENLLEAEPADDSSTVARPVSAKTPTLSQTPENSLSAAIVDGDADSHEDGVMLVSDTEQSDKVQLPLRLAYFGQINRFKGLEVLLDAVKRLPKPIRKQVHLSINGSGLEHQADFFQNTIRNKLKSLGATVSMRGRYQSCELPSLLSATDWMIVPSVWWENSPVVILEAKKYGVPVICSDIGGMQEKVDHGFNGRHFLARRSESLAEQITWAVENRHLHEEYARNMANSYPGNKAFLQHRDMYIELCKDVNDEGGELDASDDNQDQKTHPEFLRAAG